MDIERFESLNSIGVNYWMMEDFNMLRVFR